VASSAVSTQADPHSLYHFGEGDPAPVSATIATLEDAHTGPDLFETILGDGVDSTGMYELVRPLVPPPVASSSSSLSGISAHLENGNSARYSPHAEHFGVTCPCLAWRYGVAFVAWLACIYTFGLTMYLDSGVCFEATEA
jgi:hypothetical protein